MSGERPWVAGEWDGLVPHPTIVGFSPSIPDFFFDDSYDYPEGVPDFWQLIELGPELWPAAWFTDEQDESNWPPSPVRLPSAPLALSI